MVMPRNVSTRAEVIGIFNIEIILNFNSCDVGYIDRFSFKWIS